MPIASIRRRPTGHGDHLRSDHRARRSLYQPALPRTPAAHPLARCRVGQNLTNQFGLPAATVCALYKSRWQVELFFKWIKQHLRIKQFFGTSENAVKTQIWIAVSVYVLVAIVKKRLTLDASLYTSLQVLSVTLFEKLPLDQALTHDAAKGITSQITNQLDLFAY